MTSFQGFCFGTCVFLFFVSAAVSSDKDQTAFILFCAWILLISVAFIGTLLV